MATQVLDKIEVDSSQVFRLGDILPRLWSPYRTATSESVKDTEYGPEQSAEDGSCIKGAFVAISMEAGAALAIYGIWQVLHFFR